MVFLIEVDNNIAVRQLLCGRKKIFVTIFLRGQLLNVEMLFYKR